MIAAKWNILYFYIFIAQHHAPYLLNNRESISSTLLSSILVISCAYTGNPVTPKHIIEAKSEHISFSRISSTFNSNYIKSTRKHVHEVVVFYLILNNTIVMDKCILFVTNNY